MLIFNPFSLSHVYVTVVVIIFLSVCYQIVELCVNSLVYWCSYVIHIHVHHKKNASSDPQHNLINCRVMKVNEI